MPSFLDDISSFYGTGEKNEKGQTLEEFLKEYDPYQYKIPVRRRIWSYFLMQVKSRIRMH